MERNDKDASKPVARHFNLPNHSKQDIAVCSLSLHLGSSESHKTLHSCWHSTTVSLETDPLYSVLLTVCQTILKMLFRWIWYWINKQSLPESIIFFTIVTWPVCNDIVTRSFSLGPSWEFKGQVLLAFLLLPKSDE